MNAPSHSAAPLSVQVTQEEGSALPTRAPSDEEQKFELTFELDGATYRANENSLNARLPDNVEGGKGSADFFDGGWCWMRHPSINDGNAVPVLMRIVKGTRYYIPLDPSDATEFAWDERDSEWEIVERWDAAASANDRGFYTGTMCALAVVANDGRSTTWRNILNTVGPDEFMAMAAKSENDWRWSGFARFAEVEFGEKRVRAAIAVAKATGANS